MIATSLRSAAMRRLMCIVTVLAALTGTPGPADDSAGDSAFGVSIHNLGMSAAELGQIRDTGFRWVRIDFTWTDIEKTRGQYDFAATDRFVARAREAGLQVIAILTYGNPLYASDLGHGAHGRQHRADTDEFRNGYAQWAATLVSRYAGNGFLWEIWNEPNGSKFWPPRPNVAEYIALARAAAEAIHAKAPDEKLIGPATSGIAPGFLERCFQAGLLEHWYGVSVHPYRDTDPDTVSGDYDKLQELIARYAPAGKTVPLIVSEWGYTSATRRKMSEEQQAAALKQMFSVSRQHRIPVTIWYDWRDAGAAENSNNRFGLVRHGRGSDGKLVPKPAWHAAREFLDRDTSSDSAPN